MANVKIREFVDRNWRTLNKSAAAHVALYRKTNGRGQRFQRTERVIPLVVLKPR